MGELSIEEKAKAYDEALERAKNTIEVNQNIPNIVECVESLFPVLKESDEKIRKDIIVYLQYSMAFDKSFLDKKYNWSQKDCSKWIAWLEKQDDQKPETIFLKFRIGDKVTNGENTYTINFIGKDRYWVKEHDCATIPFEYQHHWKLVEQNHTDKVEPKFKIGQTIKKEGFNLGFTIVKIEDGFYFNYMGDHFPFTDQDNWELVEQKSVWSEEDEQVFNVIKSELEKYILLKQYSTPLCINDIWWFKAIKNRVQPQNTWKPSDEQITWLYRAADDAKEHSRMKQILNELLSDLKELREEYDKLDLNK